MIQIDMKLPDKCSVCRFETEAGYCKAMESGFCGSTTEEGRPEWCPLKEQEAVEPIEREGFFYCGKCRYAFTVHHQKYCSDCGTPVKWR